MKVPWVDAESLCLQSPWIPMVGPLSIQPHGLLTSCWKTLSYPDIDDGCGFISQRPIGKVPQKSQGRQKMLLLVQFWQTGETFYLPSKFLGRGKWCREYWEDSQKYIVFIFRLKAKIIREDLCCRTWGFYVGCCISPVGMESMNCQFKWNSSQIEERSLTLFSHLRIVAAVDLHMLS